MLPVESLFSDVVLSYKTVYWHFRKWSKNGEWEISWLHILNNYKSLLDLSTSSIDGSHTRALRGGEEVAYQRLKMSQTTNALYLTDNQGIPIAMSSPVSGNHHDLYQIDCHLDELFQTLKKADVDNLSKLGLKTILIDELPEYGEAGDSYGAFQLLIK